MFSSHKAQGADERLQAQGAELLDLLPYSPDQRASKKAWPKIFEHLRLTQARSRQDRDSAITEALAPITPDNEGGWFRYASPAFQEP
jgi:hypothetical protein